MVRNLVGTLVEVGKGQLLPADFWDILAAKDRRKAGMTAPAHGLYLVTVNYGEMSDSNQRKEVWNEARSTGGSRKAIGNTHN
jgi:tRNA pseudouridine38-40 synthase